MEKLKATRKEIDGYNTIAVGAHELYYMLRNVSPVAYNSGVYGWNWDAYILDNGRVNITICTGYRSTVGRRIDHSIIKKWNEDARQIIENRDKKWDEIEKELKALQNDFVSLIHAICLDEWKKANNL